MLGHLEKNDSSEVVTKDNKKGSGDLQQTESINLKHSEENFFDNSFVEIPLYSNVNMVEESYSLDKYEVNSESQIIFVLLSIFKLLQMYWAKQQYINPVEFSYFYFTGLDLGLKTCGEFSLENIMAGEEKTVLLRKIIRSIAKEVNEKFYREVELTDEKILKKFKLFVDDSDEDFSKILKQLHDF